MDQTIRLGPRVGPVSELLAAVRRIPLRERQITYWFSESLSTISLPTLAAHGPAARIALVKGAMRAWADDEFLVRCLVYLSQSGLSMSLERVHRFCGVMAAYTALLAEMHQCPTVPSVKPQCTPSTPPNGKSVEPAVPNSVDEATTSEDIESTATTGSGPKP